MGSPRRSSSASSTSRRASHTQVGVSGCGAGIGPSLRRARAAVGSPPASVGLGARRRGRPRGRRGRDRARTCRRRRRRRGELGRSLDQRRRRPRPRRRRTTATAAPTTTAPPGTVSCKVPARRQPDPDRPRYTVRLDADPAAGTVEGDLTVRFTPDLPIDRLVFRLWANAPRPGSRRQRDHDRHADQRGRPLRTAQPDATTLEVLLPAIACRPTASWRCRCRSTLRVTGAAAGPGQPQRRRAPPRARSSRCWRGSPASAGRASPPPRCTPRRSSSPAADWSVAVTVPPGNTVLASGQREADGRWHGTAMRDFALERRSLPPRGGHRTAARRRSR